MNIWSEFGRLILLCASNIELGFMTTGQCVKGGYEINPIPNNKILDMTKLKAIADDKLNIAEMTVSLFHRTENIVEKGENTGFQHFLLIP